MSSPRSLGPVAPAVSCGPPGLSRCTRVAERRHRRPVRDTSSPAGRCDPVDISCQHGHLISPLTPGRLIRIGATIESHSIGPRTDRSRRPTTRASIPGCLDLPGSPRPVALTIDLGTLLLPSRILGCHLNLGPNPRRATSPVACHRPRPSPGWRGQRLYLDSRFDGPALGRPTAPRRRPVAWRVSSFGEITEPILNGFDVNTPARRPAGPAAL